MGGGGTAGVPSCVASALPPEEEELDEELEDLAEAEKEADPLYKAKIMRTSEGEGFPGVVDDIEVGEEIFVHYGYNLNNCPDWYEQV